MERLDGKGRCCGRKPLTYKREGGPHKFCPRCDRAFNIETGDWIPNWAWSSPTKRQRKDQPQGEK